MSECSCHSSQSCVLVPQIWDPAYFRERLHWAHRAGNARLSHVSASPRVPAPLWDVLLPVLCPGIGKEVLRAARGGREEFSETKCLGDPHAIGLQGFLLPISMERVSNGVAGVPLCTVCPPEERC